MTKRILISILLVGLTIFAIAAMVSSKKAPPKKEVESDSIVVETMIASAQSQQLTVESQGSVKPVISSNLVAEVNGRITDVSNKFKVGSFVKKGDILFTIDPANYIANLKSAEAQLAQAKASYQDASARSEQARKDWKKIGRGEANDLVLKIPQLNQAKANVQSADANLLRARRDLERTKVRATFDALIKSKTVDLGQYVNTGLTVASVYGTDYAEIRLPLPDKDLSFINLPVQGDSNSYPGVILSGIYAGQQNQWFGKVVRTEGVVDESNRLTYLVAEIKDPYNLDKKSNDNPLRFGTFVKAEIEGIYKENVFSVPRLAINNNKVMTIVDENRLLLKEINIVRSNQSNVLIDSGLTDGQEIITTPIENPLNGMKVSKLGTKTKNNQASETTIEDTASQGGDGESKVSDTVSVSQ